MWHTCTQSANHTAALRLALSPFLYVSQETAPVVLWMTGGPGCSSELAIFDENGPCHIDPTTGKTVNNTYSYVCQPLPWHQWHLHSQHMHALLPPSPHTHTRRFTSWNNIANVLYIDQVRAPQYSPFANKSRSTTNPNSALSACWHWLLLRRRERLRPQREAGCRGHVHLLAGLLQGPPRVPVQRLLRHGRVIRR